jgi:hypothetical protein
MRSLSRPKRTGAALGPIGALKSPAKPLSMCVMPNKHCRIGRVRFKSPLERQLWELAHRGC